MKKKNIGALALTFVMAAACFSGCSGKEKNVLNPDQPVSLTVWHYYHGAQQTAFDDLVEEFNDTVGKEKGIYVKGYGQGDVKDLEKAVRDSMEGKVGSEETPDIFSSYADTAYEIEQMGKLANLSDYLTEEELSKFVDSYVEEGCIAKDGSLRIFPVAKSTEIMMINKTDWEKFAAEAGVSLDDLKTIEGVVKVSEKYYNWTDGKTPDVPNDGKAFYGRDSFANYVNIGMMQLGYEIFEVKDGKVTLNTDKDSLKRLWENYYVPMVKGYFGAYGSFRSDDVKTGDLVAYTGSTTSAMYFPDKVELADGNYPVEYIVMSPPVLEGGENYAVQQGAGMVVSKTDKQHEYAAVEFLKWFTKTENNLRFSCSAGYLPVLKDANNTETFDRIMKENDLKVDEKTYACVTHIFDTISDMKLYTNKSFENGSAARSVVEYNLPDKAKADREAVEAALAQGQSLETACADYVSEESFEKWYEEFCGALNDAVEGK